MKPTLVFHHAKLLEPFFKAHTLIKQPDYIEPTIEEFLEKKEEGEEKWKEIEDLFFNKTKEYFGLDYQRDILDVYIVRGARMSMSKPLIVRWKANPKLFVYELMHELLHVLLVGNKVRPGYTAENPSARGHIHLYSFIEKFYKEVLKDEEMLSEIKALANAEDYKRAWEIVETEGSDKLLKELREKK